MRSRFWHDFKQQQQDVKPECKDEKLDWQDENLGAG
jgi:hypothetical protein